MIGDMPIVGLFDLRYIRSSAEENYVVYWYVLV